MKMMCMPCMTCTHVIRHNGVTRLTTAVRNNNVNVILYARRIRMRVSNNSTIII